MSDGDMPVVLADLADPLPVLEYQLQAVLWLPGDLALEGEVGAPRAQQAAAGPLLRSVREMDVLPDVS